MKIEIPWLGRKSSSAPQRSNQRSISSEMPSWCRDLREEVIAKIPSNTEGLDTERVSSFISSYNLLVGEHIVFDEEYLPQLKELLLPSRSLRNGLRDGSPGVFIAELDLVLVVRGRDSEVLNGAIYTEGLLVHELVHASGRHRVYVHNGTTVYMPRCGFALSNGETSSGSFFEEGCAEMLRGQYIQDFSPSRTILGLLDFLSADMVYKYSVDAKYCYFTPTRGISMFAGSPAAYGLELLCERDNQLRDALLSARGRVEDLRRVARIVSQISPNLYRQLRRSAEFGFDSVGLTSGLKIIKETLGRS